MDVRYATSCSPPGCAVSGLAPVSRAVTDMTDGAGAIPHGKRLPGAGGLGRPVLKFPHGKRPWRRSLTAVVVLVWALVAVGAHAGLLSAQHHAAHAAHPLLASLGAEFAVNVDHAHLLDGSVASQHHEQFATAVLPRPATGLVALCLVATVVAVIGVVGRPIVSTGRGPPGGMAAVVVPGRDLLTRFCLARR
ncbi:hypothetical protein [Mycobacterium sp.]|uniref:hypothetical protein n=1 Tax=Mycobacterium sp. TaxID=1785 RepID=UPI003BAA2D73